MNKYTTGHAYVNDMFVDLFEKPFEREFRELSDEEQKEAWQKGEIPVPVRANDTTNDM